jgi:fermentation-respiration switch protein FrsA (DUF1100 family)
MGVRITDRRVRRSFRPLAAVTKRMLFKPLCGLETDPSCVGLEHEDVELTAEDGATLHAWHIRTPDPRTVVVVLHGNAGNICGRIAHAQCFASEGMDTLLVGYRGYGASGGVPSEEGLYCDAVGAVDHAAKLGVPVVLYGESLGGAVAVEASLRRKPSMLVLQSTFTSVPEIAAKMVPFGRFLAPRAFMSIDKVSRLTCPTQVIHGDQDEAIPYAMGVRLYEALPTRKAMLTIPGAKHNDVFEIAGADIARMIARGEGAFDDR